MGEWQINNAVTYQKKGGLNCFEQVSYNFSCEKRRAEEAKPKGPAVSHQGQRCLTWGEYVNVFLNLPQKIFFYFVVFDQFNVLLLMIMLLYCHKIGEYINKDNSFQQTSDQKGESDK